MGSSRRPRRRGTASAPPSEAISRFDQFHTNQLYRHGGGTAGQDIPDSRHHGIYSRGAAGRPVAGRQRDGKQHCRDTQKGRRIGGADAEKQSRRVSASAPRLPATTPASASSAPSPPAPAGRPRAGLRLPPCPSRRPGMRICVYPTVHAHRSVSLEPMLQSRTPHDRLLQGRPADRGSRILGRTAAGRARGQSAIIGKD